MKRATISIALIIGTVLLITFPVLRARRDVQSEHWLRMAGFTVNDAPDRQAAIVFTVSNSGPREVKFHVEHLEWIAKGSDTRGHWDGMIPKQMSLAPGNNVLLTATSSVATVPKPSEIVAFWNVSWWQEPSGMRQLVEKIERLLPFGLRLPWPAVASGTLYGYSPGCSFDDLMRLRYGLGRREAEKVNNEPPVRASVSDAADDRTLDSLPAACSSGGR